MANNRCQVGVLVEGAIFHCSHDPTGGTAELQDFAVTLQITRSGSSAVLFISAVESARSDTICLYESVIARVSRDEVEVKGRKRGSCILAWHALVHSFVKSCNLLPVAVYRI